MCTSLWSKGYKEMQRVKESIQRTTKIEKQREKEVVTATER